jgi:hypothetical protein
MPADQKTNDRAILSEIKTLSRLGGSQGKRRAWVALGPMRRRVILGCHDKHNLPALRPQL